MFDENHPDHLLTVTPTAGYEVEFGPWVAWDKLCPTMRAFGETEMEAMTYLVGILHILPDEPEGRPAPD